ncbi:MAG: hypothetical protein LBV74_14430 [Tannerella sp.]|jgi:hypothetical protein|nr:hypothetical protein [Tannerella sp.]
MYSKEKILQEKFTSLLRERIPRHLTNTLMEILPLEKEAIYRRLRGEVAFSFVEMATLSTYLGISLDNIANYASPYHSQWYHLHLRDYCEYKPMDLSMDHNYIRAINRAADDSNSEFGIAANTIPLHISLLHLPIYRVYLLKWMYQFGKTPKDKLSYANILLSEAEKKIYQQYIEAIKRIRYTFFIWDKSFFASLINDINYFYNIRIISRKEMNMLWQELIRLLNTLEYYADHGEFDTGNKIEIYVSNLNFDTSYTYLSSDNLFISMNNVYSLGTFISQEKGAYEDMKKWIQGLKKSSTLISGAAQYEKIIFFEKQKKILDNHFIMDKRSD